MLVLIRGAGDLATGIALRLFRSHLRVAMTDLPQPTAIRRTVCFSQAILYGSHQVEDVTAERAETEADVRRILAAGQIPVLADPRAACRAWLRPDVVVVDPPRKGLCSREMLDGAPPRDHQCPPGGCPEKLPVG